MTTEEQKRKKRKKILKIVGVLLILLTMVGWGITKISPPLPSSPSGSMCNLEDYRTEVQPLLKEWDDAVALANRTPRTSLPGGITSLQEIKRRTSELETGCFATTHSFLINYMEYAIEGFLAFLGQESDSAVQAKFRMAETNFETYLLRLSD